MSRFYFQRSVNDFFGEQLNEQKSSSKRPLTSNSDGPAQKTSKPEPDREPNRIRLLSWNIDGLDKKYTAARAEAVCKTILKYVALNNEITISFDFLSVGNWFWKKLSAQPVWMHS